MSKIVVLVTFVMAKIKKAQHMKTEEQRTFFRARATPNSSSTRIGYLVRANQIEREQKVQTERKL